MWELYSGRRVLEEGLSIGQVFYMIAYQAWRPVTPPNCPPGYAQLMAACWHEDPAQRPTVQQLLRSLQQLYVAEKQALAAAKATAAAAAGEAAAAAAQDESSGASGGSQPQVTDSKSGSSRKQSGQLRVSFESDKGDGKAGGAGDVSPAGGTPAAAAGAAAAPAAAARP